MDTITNIQTTTTDGQGRPHGLRAVGMAEELAVRTIRMTRTIRGHRDLVDQLTRAIESVALNLAEGSGRAGRDRTYHYTVAYGSAGESATAIRLLAAYGAISAACADDLIARSMACGPSAGACPGGDGFRSLNIVTVSVPA